MVQGLLDGGNPRTHGRGTRYHVEEYAAARLPRPGQLPQLETVVAVSRVDEGWSATMFSHANVFEPPARSVWGRGEDRKPEMTQPSGQSLRHTCGWTRRVRKLTKSGSRYGGLCRPVDDVFSHMWNFRISAGPYALACSDPNGAGKKDPALRDDGSGIKAPGTFRGGRPTYSARATRRTLRPRLVTARRSEGGSLRQDWTVARQKHGFIRATCRAFGFFAGSFSRTIGRNPQAGSERLETADWLDYRGRGSCRRGCNEDSVHRDAATTLRVDFIRTKPFCGNSIR